jgi:Tfp pilus assembly protein PilZ
MGGERRRHRRVPALFDVIWEGAAGRYEARTSDLSEGGCFIDTMGRAEVGEEIAFRLLLPAGGSLQLRGEVTYHSPTIGFGVRFTRASDEDRKRLAWLVRAEGLKAGRNR